jgi:hypothetical protein
MEAGDDAERTRQRARVGVAGGGGRAGERPGERQGGQGEGGERARERTRRRPWRGRDRGLPVGGARERGTFCARTRRRPARRAAAPGAQNEPLVPKRGFTMLL